MNTKRDVGLREAGVTGRVVPGELISVSDHPPSRKISTVPHQLELRFDLGRGKEGRVKKRRSGLKSRQWESEHIEDSTGGGLDIEAYKEIRLQQGNLRSSWRAEYGTQEGL